jgi:trimethylamine:corrinoid methyltransferase-like protein
LETFAFLTALLEKRLADYIQSDIDSNIEKKLVEYVKNRKAESRMKSNECGMQRR